MIADSEDVTRPKTRTHVYVTEPTYKNQTVGLNRAAAVSLNQQSFIEQ
jgi:hypothetical protein